MEKRKVLGIVVDIGQKKISEEMIFRLGQERGGKTSYKDLESAPR